MWHRRIAVLVLLLVLLPSVGHGASRPVARGVRVLSSATTGAVLDITTPRPVVVPLADGTLRLTVPDTTPSAEPGMPEVPLWNALLGVPAGAAVEVRVLHNEAERIALHKPLAAAPQPAPRTADEQIPTPVRVADPAAYKSTTPYPAAIAGVADDAWFRDQRQVRIAVAPIQYIAAQQQLVWHRSLRVQVRWTGADLPVPAADPFTSSLGAPLLNANVAQQWRVPPRSDLAAQPSAVAAPRFKIEVEHDGMYRLGYADLQAAGMDVARIDPRMLQLSNHNRAVAIEVLGEADGRFDPGDEIRWWGEALRTRAVSDTVVLDGRVVNADTQASALYSDATTYTDRNVYWLDVGRLPGARMAAADGTPRGAVAAPQSFRTTVRAEQSNVWWTWHFTSRDTWFWDRIIAGSPTTRTYTTTLTAPVTDVGVATVRGEIVARVEQPQIAPDHHVRVLLNGVFVAEALWDGRERYRWQGVVPQTALKDGENTLQVDVVPPAGASDDLWFDWFDVTYDRRMAARDDQIFIDGDAAATGQFTVDNFTTPNVLVYDVSAPHQPQAIRNARVEATGDRYRASFHAAPTAATRLVAVATNTLRAPVAITRYVPPDLLAGGADYIIVAPPDLITPSRRLAAYRTAQGQRTVVVNLDDLYNVFNDGVVHPVAIKRFLAHAYVHWQAPAPRYVVLVGDGHWNMQGYNPQRYGTARSAMPPNLAWADPWQGEVDSSNLLAAFVGDDLLPDVAIGRMPVRSAAELNALIDKIVAYEAAPMQPWQRRLLFVTDNGPDAAGDFDALADTFVAEEVPPGVAVDRLRMNDVCGAATSPPTPCPAGTKQLVTMFNTGALLVNYAGHASINRWAHEQILTTGTIPSLANGNRLPIVLSMTCLDGYWFDPLQASVAEELVRAGNRGAVATFSPTGLGIADGHDVLQRGFYRALFRDGVGTLGAASLHAKQALFASGRHEDLINTFTVFGDPALRVPVPSTTFVPWAQGERR